VNLKNYEADALSQNPNTEKQTFPKTQFPNDPNCSGSNSLLGCPAPLAEKLLRLAALGLALLCLAATSSRACGPFFPNNLLDLGDHAVLLAPVAQFRAELERLNLLTCRFGHVAVTNSYDQQAREAEIADLTTALKKATVPPNEASRIVESHRINRQKLSKYLDAYVTWDSQSGKEADANAPSKNGSPPAFPSFEEVPGLPGEFADYFAGAAGFRQPDAGKLAREAWERLLKRPAAERKYKSTWAAFMLGKSWEKEDDDKAVEYFQQTRALAKQRFADSLGLAVAALGLEARVELGRRNFKQAIELYLEQFAAGDESAVASLQTTATTALDDPDALRELASEPHAQKVITACLISTRCMAWMERHDTTAQANEVAARWLSAVEQAAVTDVDSAERLALAAYQTGAFDVAQRWVARAKNAPVAQWLQAKLWLHAGKTSQAAALLAKVASRLPVVTDSELTSSTEFADSLHMELDRSDWDFVSARAQVLGELGVLRLSRREFSQSLDALLRAGFWASAAYVAERVLTMDELKDYVEQNWPLVPPQQETAERAAFPQEKMCPVVQRQNIRYLLARRLTRELRGDVAREYFPAAWQQRFDELATALLAGWNENLPADQRAKALFRAAFIARTNGMELLGTEVQPDWHIWNGDFEEGVTWETRATNRLGVFISVASTNEIQRAAKHMADPERRFHYRYQAAVLAWEAAKLMPNHSDDTAFVLWTAGSWLKVRDPLTADIFYKALVRRCGRTALGAEADLKRWFPALDENGKVIQSVTPVTPEPSPTPDEFPTTAGQAVGIAPEATPDAPADSPDPIGVEQGYEYIIHKGDTLAAIVRDYTANGVSVSVQDLLDGNPGIEQGKLRVGQKIFIPAPK
jgi:hypothetical protein